MKVSVLQENFKKALEDAAPFIAKRNALPIVGGYALQTDESRLRVVATDLECAITAWCGGRIEEEGGVIVSKGILLDTVKALPKERIDLHLDGETLVLECAGRSMRLASLGPIDDYPPIPTFEDQPSLLSLGPEQVEEIIKTVIHCAATDETRPVLMGVHVSAQNGTLRFAAADGFRLGVYSMKKAIDPSASWSFIIPAASLVKVKRLLKKEKNMVHSRLSANKAQISVQTTAYEVVSQLTQGIYPNYNQLIPKDHVTHIEVLRDQLLQAVKSASVYSRNGSGIIRLQISRYDDHGRLTISARGEEVGDYEEHLLVVLKGEENKIAVNARYLVDTLTALDEDVVVMEMTGPNAPMVWGGKVDPRYIEVVMPMFVQ